MAALFSLSAVVQLNDPDPLRWILVYAAAASLSACPQSRGTRRAFPPPSLPLSRSSGR
jgi:hypothetical protein